MDGSKIRVVLADTDGCWYSNGERDVEAPKKLTIT